MIAIVRQVEIKYGTIRDLESLLSSRRVPCERFYLSAKHLNFRRKGKRNVEVISLRVEERQGPQKETHTAALELFREQKLKPGTLWEAASILPRSFNEFKHLEGFESERDMFWNEFGESISIFALGHQNPSWLGPQSAILCSRGKYDIRYHFQNFPITGNVWYVGYRYLK